MASPRSRPQPGEGEEQWKKFEQRRHRLKPPELFDETSNRHKKYDEFVASPDRELIEVTRRLADGHPAWQGFGQEEVEGGEEFAVPLAEYLDEADRSPINTELGVQKAQFFDRCLRAERSVEYPRRQALPPVKISSFKPEVTVGSPRGLWHRATTNESQEPAKRNSLPGAASLPMEEARVKLSRLDTSMLDLVNQCRRVRLHPATTGLVRADREKLKLEYGFLTDERAEAITDTLKVTASEVREAHFRSNGLSALGAVQLLDALPEELESVDLSQNDLSNDLGWCRAVRRFTRLTSLTLSDCQLADGACGELLNNLIRCKSLTRIDLSRNGLSNGAAFQPLLKRFTQLQELDVHWNHFGGDAASLLQGIIDCSQSALTSLNLSWNPLGKFSAEENCQQLVRLFQETSTLRHLDLSRCDLTMAHCQILAEGLDENKSIVGLHVSGNEAHVDAYGSLVPRRGAKQSEGQGANELDEDSCCWVCQGWRETRLSYLPGISGPEATEVWVFTSIDGFSKPVKMQREQEGFAAYVMAAPGPLRFVFQVGTEILCSRTTPQVEVREMIASMRSGLGCYKRTDLVPEEGEDGVVLKLALVLPEEEAPRSVDVAIFSSIMVVQRPADEPVCQHFVPRHRGTFLPKTSSEEWCLESSLFAPHWEPLSGKQFRERCFKVDWQENRIYKLIPDEAERSAVRELLREHYAEMKVLYGSLCSVDWKTLHEGSKPISFGIGLYQYSHMLVQHNLVGQDLSLSEADGLFVGSALQEDFSKSLEAYQTEGRLIHRHGFFGLLVRLAVRYATGTACKSLKGRFNPTQPVKKALQYLFAKHLMYPYAPMKNNLRCVQWRDTVLHTEVVEGAFRTHMKAVVDPLFNSFGRRSHGVWGLAPEDWFRMLDAMEVFPCTPTLEHAQMHAWDRVWAWQAAAMSQVDELNNPRTLQLSFVEFLEALARVVALLHSRIASGKKPLDDQQGEGADYGMGVASPVTIFCLEPAVNDKDSFAQLLDAFLSGTAPKALST